MSRQEKLAIRSLLDLFGKQTKLSPYQLWKITRKPWMMMIK